MATILVLVEGGRPEVMLDTTVMAALGELGVTGVTLVRDDGVVGVIVDGWAFDVESSAAAAAALGADRSHARVLLPVSQTTLSVRGSSLAAETRDGGER